MDFVAPALEHANKAVEIDQREDFQGALFEYKISMDYFLKAIKYEKNAERKGQLEKKAEEVMKRMEQIDEYLSNGSSEGSGAGGTVQRSKQSESNVGDEKEKLKSSMADSIVMEKPNVKWDDIAGLEAAKEALKEAVIFPIRFPHFFTGKREPWRGILMYGPPGTGKTYLAKAVATEADCTFFSVSASSLMSKWLGEAEKQVAALFDVAREHAPSIIFIDEVDSMCGARSEGENDAARRVKNEFLVQMQGVGKKDKGVLVLGATNMPYDLDSGIRRRFERRIYIPLPDCRARQRMLEIHLGDTENTLTRSDMEELAAMTEGFSGSDISVLTRNAMLEPVRTISVATHFKRIQTRGPGGDITEEYWVACSPGDSAGVETQLMDIEPSKLRPLPVTMNDFRVALRSVRPSVSAKDIQQHVAFTEEFGHEG